MRTVTLQREKNFLKAMSVYYVYCDEKLVGSVRNGQSISFDIDNNEHIVYCQVTVTMYDGDGGTTVSDVVKIPAGEESVNLLVSRGFRSLRLNLVS